MSDEHDPVGVGPNRLLTAAAAAGLLVAAGIGSDREIAAHDAVMAVLLLLAFGAMAAIYGRMALKPGARLVIDSVGIADVRADPTTRWDDVSAVRLLRRQGTFGEFHTLRLELRNGDQDLKLDLLRPGWRRVTQTVAEHSGKTVTTSRQSRRDAARA